MNDDAIDAEYERQQASRRLRMMKAMEAAEQGDMEPAQKIIAEVLASASTPEDA